MLNRIARKVSKVTAVFLLCFIVYCPTGNSTPDGCMDGPSELPGWIYTVLTKDYSYYDATHACMERNSTLVDVSNETAKNILRKVLHLSSKTYFHVKGKDGSNCLVYDKEKQNTSWVPCDIEAQPVCVFYSNLVTEETLSPEVGHVNVELSQCLCGRTLTTPSSTAQANRCSHTVFFTTPPISLCISSQTVSGGDTCSSSANCSNHRCICHDGFIGNGAVCEDINECREGSHLCHANANCTNTIGSHNCSCDVGFEGDGFNCTDIDECNTNTCGYSNSSGDFRNASCHNTFGSYKCNCSNGFDFNKSSLHCEDIDECKEGSHPCHENANCTNIIGSHNCSCDVGFEGDGFNCTDIDECNTNPCGYSNSSGDFRNASCHNTFGSYNCNCSNGFVFNTSSLHCEDINECNNTSYFCHENATCTNTVGSHNCTCKGGFTGNGLICEDINECKEVIHPCHANANCTNIIGSHNCSCDVGFTGDGFNCTDIDECKTNPCGYSNSSGDFQNASCHNTFGSYNCNCSNGFVFNTSSLHCEDINECDNGHPCHPIATCNNTIGSHTCACKSGFNGTGFYCTDINECEDAVSPRCGNNSICINIPGNYSCYCECGFTGTGQDCVDINECNETIYYCHENANCTNTVGSYNCTCKIGFNGNGFSCTDIDECDGASPCHRNATCSNTIGSHNCTCNKGFEGNGFNCTDINECDKGHVCHPNANCTNTVGSHNCTCKIGFIGDGLNCSDINECNETSHSCHENATCTNTVGSHKCTCKDGFTGNGVFCKDINECLEMSNSCHFNATCFNTVGSHNCTCKDGFVGNGHDCEDVNECTAGMHKCHANASCINTNGSYKCNCVVGWSSDGSNCIDSDECANPTVCPVNSNCLNVPGSYVCSCFIGFTGPTCADVNECSASNQPCGGERLCKNTHGSFVCSCHSGYQWDGLKCVSDVADICKTNQTACGELIQQTLINATATTAGAEEAGALLTDATASQQALTPDITKTAANFMRNLAESARIGKVKVSSSIANSVFAVTSNLLGGFKAQKSSETSASAVAELKRQQMEVVEAISSLARQVQISPTADSFTFASDSLSMKAQDVSANNDAPVSYAPNLAGNATSRKPPVIFVPPSATTKLIQRRKRSTNATTITIRFAFIFYMEPLLFYSDSNVTSVVSAELGDGGPVNDLQDPVRIQHQGESSRTGKAPLGGETRKSLKTTVECVHWDFNRSEWSTSGCCWNQSAEPPECQCNHLTNFALLVSSNTVPGDVALSIISDIGCVLSILGLAATITVHCLSRDVRRRRPAKILLNICCNLLVVYLLFVTGVSRTESGAACTMVAVLLHYFMLTTWCWMAVYSYDMYMSVVRVFREDKGGFLQRVSAFAYVTPAIIVSLTLTITIGYFDKQPRTATKLCDGSSAVAEFFSTYRAENMCWLTGNALNVAFLLPVGILFLFNLGVFATVMREVSCKIVEAQTESLKRSNKQMFLIASTMSAIMGMTWIFGYLMLISDDIIYFTIMSWLFALFNTLQGVVIFLLTCVRSPELRKVWWLPLRSVVSTSSYRKKTGTSKSNQFSQTFNSTVTTTRFETT